MNFRKKSNSVSHYIRTDSAITLIALVITIIVMLILVGVTLKIALGENGIIKNTKTATEEYSISAEEEQLAMAYTSCV